MKKIIPAIVFALSLVQLVLSAIALIVMCAATAASQAELVAVPTAIVAFVLSLLGGAFAFLFKRDVLCRISFFINSAAFALSSAAVVIWFAAM